MRKDEWAGATTAGELRVHVAVTQLIEFCVNHENQ